MVSNRRLFELEPAVADAAVEVEHDRAGRRRQKVAVEQPAQPTPLVIGGRVSGTAAGLARPQEMLRRFEPGRADRVVAKRDRSRDRAIVVNPAVAHPQRLEHELLDRLRKRQAGAALDDQGKHIVGAMLLA